MEDLHGAALSHFGHGIIVALYTCQQYVDRTDLEVIGEVGRYKLHSFIRSTQVISCLEQQVFGVFIVLYDRNEFLAVIDS